VDCVSLSAYYLLNSVFEAAVDCVVSSLLLTTVIMNTPVLSKVYKQGFCFKLILQHFGTVGWATGRVSGLEKFFAVGLT